MGMETTQQRIDSSSPRPEVRWHARCRLSSFRATSPHSQQQAAPTSPAAPAAAAGSHTHYGTHLQRRQRLVEVDGQADAGQVLAHHVLDQAPQAEEGQQEGRVGS